jgi:hypothetical protein
MLLVLSPIVLVIVLVLVIDFWSPFGVIGCLEDVEFIRFERAKIDHEDEHDWRQDKEHWDAAKQSHAQGGEVRAAEAGAC